MFISWYEAEGRTRCQKTIQEIALWRDQAVARRSLIPAWGTMLKRRVPAPRPMEYGYVGDMNSSVLV